MSSSSDRNSQTQNLRAHRYSGDPDDKQSLVRFLTYANEFDVEGLIATTSCWKQNNPDTPAIVQVLEAYAKIQPNLLKHASGYPTVDSLKNVTKTGVNGYGMSVAAEQLDNEGIGHIISIVDRDDHRPIWFLSWGGSNTLGGAVMKVKDTRSDAQARAFVAKIRGYQIAIQDDGHAYIANHFPQAKLISSSLQWKGMSKTTPTFNHWPESWGGNNDIFTHDWIRNNIQENLGPLGMQYPKAVYLWEGDTPSFLYLIPNGLGSPEHPSYGSWGGRFKPTKQLDDRSGTGNQTVNPRLDACSEYRLYSDAMDTWIDRDTTYSDNAYAPIFRWRTAFQYDFQARMDWCVKPHHQANHPPVAVCSGQQTQDVVAGSVVHLSADSSSDPDGDALSYHWVCYPEAGTFQGDITIHHADSPSARFIAPPATPGIQIHIILAVTDHGAPSLTRYQRRIFNIVA